MARSFVSDNTAAVHPRVLDAIARANDGHAAAYGDDAYTQSVARRLEALVGGEARAFLAFNGTGANVVGLAAMLRPFEAVLCAEGAHVAVDECAALERFVGCKVVTIPTPDGKLTPALVEPRLARLGDPHAAQPKVVTISQSTETGLVYSAAEAKALADFAHARGLRLHVDGARIANAAAALGDLQALTSRAGVDALSFGGTKNGALAAEAVVVLDPALARDLPFVRKQAMQLSSKMRYVAAQLDALLTDDLWLANARHANAMAALLAGEAAQVPGVQIARPAQANAVFARLPPAAIAPLQKEWPFYVWDAPRHEVRWMCSWDTTEDDVRGFVAALRKHAPA